MISMTEGFIGPAGGSFMYIALVVTDGDMAEVETALADLDARIEELGTVQIAQTRDYIHNNGFRAYTLIVNPASIALGIQAMKEQLNLVG